MEQCQNVVRMMSSSRDGVHLRPESSLADKTIDQNGSIDTSFDPPLFSSDSTVPLQPNSQETTKIFFFFKCLRYILHLLYTREPLLLSKKASQSLYPTVHTQS